MPKGVPNRKPLLPADDDHDDGQPARSHVQAGSKPPPATTGASSVFALAGAGAGTSKAKRAPMPALDPLTVPIRKSVPLPAIVTTQSPSAIYATLWQRLAEGDMVELPSRRAKSFHAWVKKQPKARCALRALGPDRHGVWRLA